MDVALGPNTICWKPDSRACFPTIPVGGCSCCRLLSVVCLFLWTFVKWETVKQEMEDVGVLVPWQSGGKFLYLFRVLGFAVCAPCSGEKASPDVSPLHFLSAHSGTRLLGQAKIQLGSSSAPQYWSCGCPLGITHLREHPRVCRAVSLETAYPICKHSTMIIHLIERNSWKWLKSLLVGQSQPLCQTPPTVPSATILPKRARVCVCAHIKILAKVVNDRITNFMKLKAPRRPAGAFPKPGNQTAGLSTLSSAPTAAHVARFWQQTPGSRDASEIPHGSRCSWNGVFVWYTCEVCVSHKIQRMWQF